MTLRIELDDKEGFLSKEGLKARPVIWLFWHKNILCMAAFFQKYKIFDRQGAVLTSPSGDGELIAEVMSLLGVDAIRGSNFKRPISSTLETIEWLERKFDVVITPDGPRGPSEKLKEGVMLLAKKSHAQILPISIRAPKSIRLKTWDKFIVPYPFSTVYVCFNNKYSVNPDAGEEILSATKNEIEAKLF